MTYSSPHQFDDERRLLNQGQGSIDPARWLANNQDFQDEFAGSFVFEYSMAMQNAEAEPHPITTITGQQYGVGKYKRPSRLVGGTSMNLTKLPLMYFLRYCAGYFTPEECDDVSVVCRYQALPLFEDLQNAYHRPTKLGNTSYVQRRNDPENSRTPSQCPVNFTLINSFKWRPDTVADLKCPLHGKESKFKCNVFPNGLRTPKHALSSTGSESTLATLLYSIAFLSLVSAIYAFVMRFVERLRESNEEYGDEPKWITVIVPSVARTAETADESDESAGLVSMRGWNYYKSHAQYHSTDADSDVREERAFNYYRGGVIHQSIESQMSRESIDSELSDESYQNPKASRQHQSQRVP